MLCPKKHVTFKLPTLLFSLRQLRTKPTRLFKCRESDEEDKDHSPKPPENHIHLLKSRGQHLLTNPRVLDTIVRKSNIQPTDTVLEIGPGTGNLTVRLLQAAKRVVAVEIDKRMVDVLWKRVAEQGLGDRLTVICNDALKTEFPQFDLVVANIPYGISSPLVAKLVFGENQFRTATLLLQKEFARRLMANPGDSEFNRLAVNVKLAADVEFIMDVSKRDFLPCPKVDSSVVRIRPKDEIPDVNLEEWWAFTRTCFSKKNKTLGATFKQKKKLMELMKLSGMKEDYEDNNVNCLGNDGISDVDEEEVGTGITSFREKLIDILRTSSFEDKRPSKLSHEELLHLLSLVNQAGIYFHDKTMLKNASSYVYSAAFD
ncbi:RNA methyltransferase [Lithospermum erythrorhizon]|uniref:rRNA adenine N(6)-methyltransferase n=1 Tax=Lithospermum erythrorhizon TaxID=34254 RepID=A0AAV3RSR7_LITER